MIGNISESPDQSGQWSCLLAIGFHSQVGRAERSTLSEDLISVVGTSKRGRRLIPRQLETPEEAD